MDGGIIKGQNAKYGGAIYISKDCTFIMNGGVIMNNSASYGGAIYVEKGGKCILNKGVIQDNTATNRGCDIYCEDPADLEVSEEFIINRNSNDLTKMIEPDKTTRVGHLEYGADMHYMYYGSYPQSYIGYENVKGYEHLDIDIIKNLKFIANSEEPIKKYKMTYYLTDGDLRGEWKSYYYDGSIYVRGINVVYRSALSTSYYYANKDHPNQLGEPIPDNDVVVWFKLEPIKWIVLNYDDVRSRTAECINLLSCDVLTALVEGSKSKEYNWEDSNLRNWLNEQDTGFLYTAFSLEERKQIVNTVNYNNEPNNYMDLRNNETLDKVYCLSSQEYLSYPFENSAWSGLNTESDYKKICSPTDFARSNSVFTYDYFSTAKYNTGCSCMYWTRSAGWGIEKLCVVDFDGSIRNSLEPTIECNGVRPAISLKIEPLAKISDDTVVMGNPNGRKDVDYKDMHYMYFGSYPQSYVGRADDTSDTLISTLNGLSEDNVVRNYTMQYEFAENTNYGKWKCYYNPSDRSYYVKGLSKRYPNDDNNYQKFFYMNKTNPSDNGPAIPEDGTEVWFKVEPIRWIVLNYDDVKNGIANTIDLISYNALTAMVQFNDDSSTSSPTNSVWYASMGNNEYSSVLRTWLNCEFLTTAFNLEEQNTISLKSNYNNWTDNIDETNSNYSGHRENKSNVVCGEKTYNLISQDKVYCLSIEDYLNSSLFDKSPWSNGGGTWTTNDCKRLCSPSDFARSNYCLTYSKSGSTYGTTNYPNGGTCDYWSRSAGFVIGRAFYLSSSGYGDADTGNMYYFRGVRPALSLII